MWYQGPDYEDPNPPEEAPPDPKAKKAAAKGQPAATDEPAPPRMITPDPILMENESGRTFKFELGRMEKDLQTATVSIGSPMGSVPPT